MRWISLKDAPALIGGNSRREELGLAGAAGDVSARLRHENGTSSPMRCQLWLLTDLIDWGRSSIRWPRHPYNPRGPYNPAFRQYEGTTYYPVAIEIDRLSLIETFGEPVEKAVRPAARRAWRGIDDAPLIARMRELVQSRRAQSRLAAAQSWRPRRSGTAASNPRLPACIASTRSRSLQRSSSVVSQK